MVCLPGCKSAVVLKDFGISTFRRTKFLSADIVRSDWTFLGSWCCEQCLPSRDVNTSELLVLQGKTPAILPL